MDLTEARAIFAKSCRREGRDEVGRKHLIDAYWAADRVGRYAYDDAAVVLFAKGEAEERELALSLWLASSFDVAATDAMVERYVATGDPTLASHLGDTPTMAWSDYAADTLTRRFLADPVGEWRLANNVVSRCGSAAVYAAFEEVLGALEDPYALSRLWSGAKHARIQDRYVAAVRTRGAELRRALADLFEEPWRARIAA